jgi:NAD(P)H-nitrite reductase large subunit
MLEDGAKGVVVQRDRQTYAVAPHIPCGLVTPEFLRTIATVAEKYKAAALKITYAGRIAIVGLKEEDIDAVWRDLGRDPGYMIGLCVRSVRACPGTSFCKRGQQDSLKLGLRLDGAFHGMRLPGKCKMAVSGCLNNCAESWVRDVGFFGKKGGWTMVVGGNVGARPRIGQVVVENLDDETAFQAATRAVEWFAKNAKPHERIGKTLERLGLESFKADVFSSPAPPSSSPSPADAQQDV